jgi:UDP-glucuronate 4-epimerase
MPSPDRPATPSRRVLVTGAAGFIGHHLTQRLLARGDAVTGLDNLNAYYDPALKHARLALTRPHPAFDFVQADLSDRAAMAALFARPRFDAVVHLGAQAGVRYSLDAPMEYIHSNLVGFGHVLEGCRAQKTPHLLYASSSSVYGANGKLPWSTADSVDHPVSLYAATKKSNELMAHAYAHLYGIPCTGLRFFTVYGTWGRPDMAYYKFAQAIARNQPIQIYNEGRMQRDFTYVDDVIDAILRLIDLPPQGDPAWDEFHPDPASSRAPWRVYNIGNHQPVALMEFVETLERLMGRTAVKQFLPMQPGDVPATYADVAALQRDAQFAPATPLALGLERFVRWFDDYHRS